MKLRALPLLLAALLAEASPRAELPVVAKVPHRVPRPPLDVVVAGSILVRGPVKSLPGAHRVAVLADGTERWDFDEPMGAEETVARRDALAHDRPELEVELDLWRSAQNTPNDDGFGKQWALSLLKATDAWKITTGDPDLTVAVVDTGYVDHPDLVDRLVPGYDFITDLANAGDGDGRDVDARDAGDESQASSSFHGPHVSGIVAATTNNRVGMAGVDWLCKLQPVRVLGVRRHRGKDSDIADGIRWAAGLSVPNVPQNKTPARVINLSFGGPGFSRVLQDAVSAAVARGVVVIGSAGNNGEDARTNVPAALEGVMSIAAAGPDGTMASYSNHGARVDLMAPGGASFLDVPVEEEKPGAIWSTSWVRASQQPVFAYAAGTSQAAAYASGVAALVRAAAPSLPPEVVAAVMRRASSPPKGGCPQGCGAGLLDASKAVAYAKQIEVAMCGEAGCGKSNVLPPEPMRPEEGCSVGRGRSASSLPAFALLLAGALLLRRRARGLALALPLSLLGCGGDVVDRESQSQSNGPITVKIVDPIPTYEAGDLVIQVGEGRFVEAQVVPSSALDRVEMRIAEPPLIIGRVGHAPFKFFLPRWAPGEEGRRLVCITAYDNRNREGETCFLAIK